MRLPRIPALALALLTLAGCSDPGGPVAAPTRHVLPGERVYPEGIGVDKATGDFYVGSTADGTIFRGNVARQDTEVFSAAGRDGRTAVTGIKVDADRRVWAAGRFTGRAYVYRPDGALVTTLLVPPDGPTLLNDLTFTPGATFFSDSFRPTVWRVSSSGEQIGSLEPWLDLRGTVVPVDTAFGLNGISASDDGRYLLTVHFDTGRLFRIEVATKAVTEVDLGGATLRTGDGLLLDGRTLLVVREDPAAVFPVEMSADLLTGRVGEAVGQGSFAFPTTVAEYEGRLLVVNSQFDRGGFPTEPGRPTPPAPVLPFTVSQLPAPQALLSRTPSPS